MSATGSTIRTIEGGSTDRARDRVFAYAVAVSLAVHFIAVGMIARGYAYKSSPAAVRQLPRYIKIDLVDLSSRQANQHPRVRSAENQAPRVIVQQPVQPINIHTTSQPRVVTLSKPSSAQLAPPPNRSLTAALSAHVPRLKSGVRASTPGDPGGKLNVGATTPGGDLPGNWSGGGTPVGWVPGNEHGAGKGSGSGAGTGSPDPPQQADPGPSTRPAPAPTPTPAPARVTVKICNVSGLRAGEYCKDTKNESFLEDRVPSRICDRCKEPEHHSRLADRANPELIKDSRPTIPSSVPEGLSLTVVIEYTVTADGDVEDVRVTRSSGYKALDRAVVDSASRLKYKPAVQDGVPRSVKKMRTYTINT